MVEEIDKAWLNRQRMPPDTMLLKAQHWLYSNLRAPDMRLECPQTTPDQRRVVFRGAPPSSRERA